MIESFSGEKFYLVAIVAFILKYLKDLLIDHFSRLVIPLKTTDFDWVITVPAIWDARGKRMMREAAYLVSYISIFVAINCQLILQAGLLNESGGIDLFTTLSYHSLPLPKEINPDKLSLALEPESAALYSQEMVTKHIASDASATAISRPTDYMVIDIGGGTVDITAHVEVDGGIVVENIPTGNAWGGTQVNEAFSKMLQNIVDDAGFSRYLASGNHAQKMAALNKILYVQFEDQKLAFGKCVADDISIDLPANFCKFYDDVLEDCANTMDGIECSDDMLYIDKEVVESQLFGPALDGIIECTLEAIEENKYKVNAFYLVGGFGGCKYVHEKVTAAIKKAYKFKDRSCTVLVPPTPHLAVATGAAMWRKNPEKIKARRSDATYGIDSFETPFNSAKHDEHYKVYNEDQKKYQCRDVFTLFLEKGELAKANEIVTIDLIPNEQTQTNMALTIYATPLKDIHYVKNKNGMSTATKIGQLLIDIPNPNNLPREDRIVDVTMDFSGTEIQAKAKYRVTGKEVKTVCDFLSAQ